MISIPKRPVGRPPRLNIDMKKVRYLVDRGASIRQVRDILNLSFATAQRAVYKIRNSTKSAK